jgi:hypothetical protein
MTKKPTSKIPRRAVKRLPKLKGGELLEVTIVSRKSSPGTEGDPFQKQSSKATTKRSRPSLEDAGSTAAAIAT